MDQHGVHLVSKEGPNTKTAGRPMPIRKAKPTSARSSMRLISAPNQRGIALLLKLGFATICGDVCGGTIRLRAAFALVSGFINQLAQNIKTCQVAGFVKVVNQASNVMQQGLQLIQAPFSAVCVANRSDQQINKVQLVCVSHAQPLKRRSSR